MPTIHLSCSKCSVNVSVAKASTEPSTWPQHRCGHDVRPFDQCDDEGPAKPALPPLSDALKALLPSLDTKEARKRKPKNDEDKPTVTL